MMQLNTFVDEGIKILYILSFMHGGILQHRPGLWVHVETSLPLSDLTPTLSVMETVCLVQTSTDWSHKAELGLNPDSLLSSLCPQLSTLKVPLDLLP